MGSFGGPLKDPGGTGYVGFFPKQAAKLLTQVEIDAVPPEQVISTHVLPSIL